MVPIEPWRNSTPVFGAAAFCTTNIDNFRAQAIDHSVLLWLRVLMDAPDTQVLWKLWQGLEEPACQQKWGSLTFAFFLGFRVLWAPKKWEQHIFIFWWWHLVTILNADAIRRTMIFLGLFKFLLQYRLKNLILDQFFCHFCTNFDLKSSFWAFFFSFEFFAPISPFKMYFYAPIST